MPSKRPRKKIITTYEEPEPEPVSVPAFEDDPDEETVAGIVNQFGPGDVAVKVYRQTPSGREYCYTSGPEVNEETVRSSCGPGKYLLHVIINGEFRKAIPIAIAAIQGNAPGGFAGDSMTQMLLNKIDRLEERLSHQPQREPIAELGKLAIEMAQLTKETTPPWQTMMDVFKLGLETAKSGGGEGESVWEGIAKAAAPALAPVLAGMVQARNGNADGGIAGPMANPAPTAAIAAGNGNGVVNVEEQLKARLKEGFHFLKQFAISPDADPGLWVDVIVARRNEQEYAYLIHKAIGSEFSAFVEIDPDIARPEYAAFFRAIYDGLRSVFSAKNQVDDDSGRPSGNKGHTSGNGKVSAISRK